MTITRDSISRFYSCDTSSYIMFVYCQCHVDSLKCTEQNVNNQTLTQVSHYYVHVSFCLEVFRACPLVIMGMSFACLYNLYYLNFGQIWPPPLCILTKSECQLLDCHMLTSSCAATSRLIQTAPAVLTMIIVYHKVRSTSRQGWSGV